MEFADTVYGYERFVDAAVFATADTAVEEVTKEKETNTTVSYTHPTLPTILRV